MEAPPPPSTYAFGFKFNDNDSVEYFLGGWIYTDSSAHYIGNYRKYKTKKDSLFIFNPDNKLYRSYSFKFVSNDTLRLCKNDTCHSFIRFDYGLVSDLSIDSIKISRKDGWGMNIEYKVTSDGVISYKDLSYNEEGNIFYKEGTISTVEFKEIQNRYNKCNLVDLKDHYGIGNDGTIFIIEIFYDEEVKKEVLDYEGSAPMKFVWANIFLMNLIYDKLQINE